MRKTEVTRSLVGRYVETYARARKQSRNSPIRPTAMPSSCGDICRSTVPGADRDKGWAQSECKTEFRMAGRRRVWIL